MAKPKSITMSMRELDRLKTIQQVVGGTLSPATAAHHLELSRRQLDRLVKRYVNDGPAGLISRQRGQPGHRQLAPGLAHHAMSIIRERYADFGPTLACEKLRELHSIVLAKETVRQLMLDAGLWIPRRLQGPGIYQPRNRRDCIGELIQIDGSDHAWFEDRAPACTLLVYIDDATSRLMHLHFTYSESTFSYFDATKAYLERYGKPLAFYSDKATVFRCNRKEIAAGDGYTQFGRALYQLNIESICANSSQAKGRVERANKTLQDRLVKELRLQGISTHSDANRFAAEFMHDYNQRFAKPARNDYDAHRPLRDDEDLALIFTWREARKVTRALTVQYDKTMFLLDDTPDTRRLIGRYIEVYEYPDGRIEVRADGAALPFIPYDRLVVVDQGAIVENKRLGHVLQIAQLLQEQRDSRRGRSAPARTNQGEPPVELKAKPGTKAQRKLTLVDLEDAILKGKH